MGNCDAGNNRTSLPSERCTAYRALVLISRKQGFIKELYFKEMQVEIVSENVYYTFYGERGLQEYNNSPVKKHLVSGLQKWYGFSD